MQEKIKHLEFIQGVINRLAQCSFLLKGWSVILLSGLFALAAKESNSHFVYIAYLPALAFWILDSYYLYQERLYRQLYDKIRKLENNSIDFIMNTSICKANGNVTWFHSVFSKTLLLFHGSLIMTIIVVTLALLIAGGKSG